MSEAIEGDRTFVDKFPEEARVVRASLLGSFLALTLGAIFGIIQTLHRTDVARIIPSTDYYTVLTAHGVFLAISFTTFFLVGLFTWAVTRSLDRPLLNIKITWTWYALMSVGMTMTGISILAGFTSAIDMSADVLFTFYAPLQAHPLFYAGLAVFIVGSWIAGADFFRAWLAWKRDNPDERIPLQTFMVLTTMAMWYIASSAVAASVLIFLLPWSLGLIDQVNPTLTRTLFWFFGHPVVYFWLMPAYLLWYTVLPKIAGGRLFSDPLARVVFVLFLLLSTPVGIHHQYLDPGIAEGFKFISMTNTMFLLLPSLLTAFTVVASVEYGMNINYMIHNTIWVPGHFHLTVGTAVALTFMAATYWLWPQITNKPIYSRSIGLFQVVVWFVGMALMSNAMHAQGMLGVPRRTAEPEYAGFDYPAGFGGFEELNVQIAIGGTLLFVSTVLFIGNLILTEGNPRVSGLADPLPPALSGPTDSPQVLDNLRLWVSIALVLVVLAYALPLAAIINRGGLLGPGVGTYPVWLAPLLDALANAVTPLLGVVADAPASLVEVIG